MTFDPDDFIDKKIKMLEEVSDDVPLRGLMSPDAYINENVQFVKEEDPSFLLRS